MPSAAVPVRHETVDLHASGVRLAAVLHRPAEAEPGSLPGLVFTGPFTGVKEQVVGTYAAGLAAHGFACLVFDHRGWGASDGEPRRDENAGAKLDDLQAATSALANHPLVDADRVGCVGICLGGAYALLHSAFDPRIRAAAFVAAAFNSVAGMRTAFGEEGYRAALADFAARRTHDDRDGTLERMPAVDPEGGEAAMGGREPWDYYGTERSSSPGWHNDVTRRSVRTLITLDAAPAAELLTAPTLFVHGRVDDFCSPQAAQATYDRTAAVDKELVWVDTTNHIDLYDVPAYVEPAIDTVGSWLTDRLGRLDD